MLIPWRVNESKKTVESILGHEAVGVNVAFG